ncbi:MAG: DUF2889 domain-containing protein [Motiliproteus sp.]
MPLPPSCHRSKVHSRQIQCDAFERDDGLWDIEGHLTDVKSFDWINRDRGGVIRAGEPLHGMSLRLTIDLDFNIHRVDAVIDFAPHNICAEIVGVYKKLEGHRIGPGWTRLTKQLFGGVTGCTHLRELLGPIAATAFQALFKPRRLRELEAKGVKNTASISLAGSPEVINTCHAWDERGPAVKEFWPDYYKQSGRE